jgi:hypothetical protein
VTRTRRPSFYPESDRFEVPVRNAVDRDAERRARGGRAGQPVVNV